MSEYSDSPELKTLLESENGIFSTMPDSPWIKQYSPKTLDILLYTSIGKLRVNPSVEQYIENNKLDIQRLADMFLQHLNTMFFDSITTLKVRYASLFED